MTELDPTAADDLAIQNMENEGGPSLSAPDKPAQQESRENNPVRSSTWSLEDILELSPEMKQEKGNVEVITGLPNVKDKKAQIEFTPKGNSIKFDVLDGQQFKDALEQKTPFQLKFETSEDGSSVLVLPEFEMVIKVSSSGTESENASQVVIAFSRYVTSYLADGLKVLGLQDVLKKDTIPEQLTPDFVREIGAKGYVDLGDRKVAVKMLEDADFQSLIPTPPEGRVNLFHGTSLAGALSIARSGLFSEGPQMVRPILSQKPDVMALKLAKNEWGSYPRMDGSQYGAILVFQTDPAKVLDRGNIRDTDGKEETIYQPSQTFDDQDELYRLRRGMKSGRPGGEKPGYLAPEDVVEIILVKQTKIYPS